MFLLTSCNKCHLIVSMKTMFPQKIGSRFIEPFSSSQKGIESRIYHTVTFPLQVKGLVAPRASKGLSKFPL